ncbi:centromere protein U [Solea solea]|uniref:centromere protein U n=1 Tax=Solea solea TaxID=90069 RepID=UPI00272B3F75|nr:centromere protein U [Solea solea]
MRNKKGGGAKVPTKPPAETHKASSFDYDSPNLSGIGKVSFLEGLQGNHGNVLHSTAIEEALNAFEEGQTDKEQAGRKDDPQVKAKQRGAVTKRKNTETTNEEEKRGSGGTGQKAEARPNRGRGKGQKKLEPEAERNEADANAVPQTSKQQKDGGHLVGKKPTKRTSPGKTKAARPLKNQQMKGTKRKSQSDNEKSCDPESQESDTDVDPQRRKGVLSSDEEVVDDTCWKPTPKKAKVKSFSRRRQSSSESKSRKSSSGSASAGAERPKKRGGQPGTELEVVLDAFLDFCEQYKESVESKAVKESIHLFSYNVKEQLLEKISLYKELRVLKRENAKVASLIRTKTSRLFDAKHEFMRAERQLLLLQKERSELKQRLTDLRRSNAFLHDLRELNQRYLDYRHQHPEEKEKYGASSLPALLLEAKHIQKTEHELRSINDRMEKRLFKNNGTCK